MASYLPTHKKIRRKTCHHDNFCAYKERVVKIYYISVLFFPYSVSVRPFPACVCHTVGVHERPSGCSALFVLSGGTDGNWKTVVCKNNLFTSFFSPLFAAFVVLLRI